MESAVSKPGEQPAEFNLLHFLICLLCACSLAGMALCGKVMTDEGLGVLVQCTSMVCGSFVGVGITEYIYPGSLRIAIDIARGQIPDMDWTLHVWFWISAVGTEFLWLTIFCTELFFDSANTLSLSQGLSVVFITLLAYVFVERPLSVLSLISVCLGTLGVALIVGAKPSGQFGPPLIYIMIGAFLNALRNVAVETLCEFNQDLFVNEVIVSARFAIGGPFLAIVSLCIAAAMAIFDPATVSIVSMGVVWTNVVLQSVIPITLFSEMLIRGTHEGVLILSGMAVVVLASLVVPLLGTDVSSLDTADSNNKTNKKHTEYEEIPDEKDVLSV